MNKAHLKSAAFLTATWLLLGSAQATTYNTPTDRASLSVTVNSSSGNTGLFFTSCRNTLACNIALTVNPIPNTGTLTITNTSKIPATNVIVDLTNMHGNATQTSPNCASPINPAASCTLTYAPVPGPGQGSTTLTVTGSNTVPVNFTMSVVGG